MKWCLSMSHYMHVCVCVCVWVCVSMPEDADCHLESVTMLSSKRHELRDFTSIIKMYELSF